MPFSEHVFKLCLDYQLYSATIHLQADMGLGKAYAGMLPFVEGLHVMGYLDEEAYCLYKEKYSVSLETSHNLRNKSPVERLEERTRESERKSQNKLFGEVAKQWGTLKLSTKDYWLKKAKAPENCKLKNAKAVLELAELETFNQ